MIDLLQELVTVHERTLVEQKGLRTGPRPLIAHRELDACNGDSKLCTDFCRHLFRPVLTRCGPAVLEQPPRAVGAANQNFRLVPMVSMR